MFSSATIVSAQECRDAMAAHRERVDGLLARHPRRLADGSDHPVWSFLSTYYSYRPAQLRRWHPGFGVVIPTSAADRHRAQSGYVDVEAGTTVSTEHLLHRLDTVRFVERLLTTTARRPARLNCFGMHEWAMVYRADAEQIRHGGVGLRLGGAGTDAVVESMELRCTHFDAFRFFTPAAKPLNFSRSADLNKSLPLSRADQVDDEQPGCVHAGMDLYKWAYKLAPLIDSDVLIDALELAFALRELDMRASPYDLHHLGFAPIAVETPTGRAEYVRRQSELSQRAAAVRTALADRCARLIAAAEQAPGGVRAIVTGE
ncbi:hypothetical protein [Jongsikchunia kroppenstedtii]|uniref:hypothetical protein n=1 Tax=Jongsikchunia kroppenstedtii TaxID=1121721 RepID=UPI000369CDB9|nr:hypothetical protein [Jongsikchunia kroppenstedtii]